MTHFATVIILLR